MTPTTGIPGLNLASQAALPESPLSPTGHSTTSRDMTYPTPRNVNSTYDFTPFISAPAVIHTALPYKSIQVVDIPRTLIPSPLAKDLAPVTIKDLKEYLCGEGEIGGQDYKGGSERGKEIWLSWKRAWDLWNNYYIEGRVNAVWVREELERREEAENAAKELKKNLKKRKRLASSSSGGMSGRGQEKEREDGYRPMRKRGDGNENREDSDGQMVVRGGSVGEAMEWIEGKDNQKQSRYMPIYDKWCGETEQGRPAPRPGRIWVRSGEEFAKTGKTGLKIKKKNEQKSIEKFDTLKQRVRPGQGMVAVKKGDQVPIVEERPIYKLEVEERIRRARPLQNIQGAAFSPAHSGMSPKVTRASSTQKQLLPRGKKLPIIQTTRSREERPSSNDGHEFPDNMEVDELDDGSSIFNSEPEPQSFVSSGGYIAMKDPDDYKEPKINWDNTAPEWDDVIQNSVWRPRRVGEKEVKVDLDDDLDVFIKSSKLEVDGGVDCGRSPYPVGLYAMSHFVLEKKVSTGGGTRRIANSTFHPGSSFKNRIHQYPLRPIQKEKNLGRSNRHHLQHAHSTRLSHSLPLRPTKRENQTSLRWLYP